MRPLPVTFIGYYQILRGIISGLFALSILVFAGLATKLVSLAAEGNALERFISYSGHIAGVVILVASAFHIVAAVGVLGMQNWGRLLTVLLCALGLATLLPFLHALVPVVFAVINAATILYLVMPATKQAFRRDDKPLRAAA